MNFSEGIKPGILMVVESWENDGDHRNTIILDGLSQDQAKLYKAVCESCVSGSYDDDKFGNMLDDKRMNDKQRERLHALVNMFPDEFNGECDDDNFNILADIAGDLMGYSEWYWFRVCESVKIFNVEEQIVFTSVSI